MKPRTAAGTLTLLLDVGVRERQDSIPGLESLRRRDDDAISWLVNEHQALVLGLAQSMGLRGADLEDAAAEVFAHVYRAVPGFRGDSQLRTWLYRIAVRTLSNWRQKARRNFTSLTEEPHDPVSCGPAQLVENAERNQHIWAAVARLAPREAAAIDLHYRQGWPLEDIAAALNCPVGTVKTLLFRSRQRLRDMLAGEEDEP